MISICTPTRGRPEIFKQMYESALNLAASPDNIEFIIYRDSDDPAVYEYPKNTKIITSYKKGLYGMQMAHECHKLATGPIHMFMTDDALFETKDWDKYVEAEFEKYPDKIVLVCPDFDDWDRLGFGIVGFVHQNWFNVLGHVMNQSDGAQSGDRWLSRVATKIGRSVRLKEMRIKNLNIRDEMHKAKNRRGREEKWTMKYHEPDMVKLRKEEMNKLSNFIKNFR